MERVFPSDAVHEGDAKNDKRWELRNSSLNRVLPLPGSPSKKMSFVARMSPRRFSSRITTFQRIQMGEMKSSTFRIIGLTLFLIVSALPLLAVPLPSQEALQKMNDVYAWIFVFVHLPLFHLYAVALSFWFFFFTEIPVNLRPFIIYVSSLISIYIVMFSGLRMYPCSFYLLISCSSYSILVLACWLTCRAHPRYEWKKFKPLLGFAVGTVVNYFVLVAFQVAFWTSGPSTQLYLTVFLSCWMLGTAEGIYVMLEKLSAQWKFILFFWYELLGDVFIMAVFPAASSWSVFGMVMMLDTLSSFTPLVTCSSWYLMKFEGVRPGDVARFTTLRQEANVKAGFAQIARMLAPVMFVVHYAFIFYGWNSTSFTIVTELDEAGLHKSFLMAGIVFFSEVTDTFILHWVFRRFYGVCELSTVMTLYSQFAFEIMVGSLSLWIFPYTHLIEQFQILPPVLSGKLECEVPDWF